MTVEFSFQGDVPTPRDAATVLVLREGDGRPEVFFVKRSAGANFMSGAYVFPGGRLDPGDRDPAIPCDLSPDEAALRLGDDDPVRALALHVAALRECLEESGILLSTETASTETVAALRSALAPREAPPLAPLLKAHKVTLAARSLVAFSRWVTPSVETRRFDARFFLARSNTRNEGATHDGSETVASAWISPEEAIERALRREIVLAPPTWRTLDSIRHARNVDEVIACAPATLVPLEPTVAVEGDAICVVLPSASRGAGFSSFAARFAYEDGLWVPIG